MGKFKEYLNEQTQDIKGMYDYASGGEVAMKGSTVKVPHQYTPKAGISTLRVGMDALNNWMQPKAVGKALQVTNWFGPPNVLTNHKAMWFKIAGFDKVIVKDEAVVNQFPEFHVEMVYGTKRTPVPPEFQTPLAAVSQSFLFDGLKKEVTYRCRDIIGCAVALGFAQDVVDGEAEPTMDELAMRFENIEIPQWFDISVKQWMDYELVRDQGKAWKQEMGRTGGKYGRGYHWKLGRVPMDMEQDLNIKESINEGHVFASWKNGVLTWRSDLGGRSGSTPMKKKPTEKEAKKYIGKVLHSKGFTFEYRVDEGRVTATWKKGALTWKSPSGQKMVASGPRWRDKAPSEKEVKKHLEKILKTKDFTLEYKVDEASFDVDTDEKYKACMDKNSAKMGSDKAHTYCMEKSD